MVRKIPGFGLIGGCSTGCSSQDVKLGKLGADAAGELHSGKIDKADVGDWIRTYESRTTPEALLLVLERGCLRGDNWSRLMEGIENGRVSPFKHAAGI